jgi:hypothetical protein
VSDYIIQFPGGARWTPARKQYTAGAVRLSEAAAADFLGIGYEALKTRRRRGTGPRSYIHMGRIAYNVEELESYRAQQGVPA